jgi:uracil-DNA glycosylase
VLQDANMPKGEESGGKRKLRAAAQRLEGLERAGVTHLPRPLKPAAAPAQEAKVPSGAPDSRRQAIASPATTAARMPSAAARPVAEPSTKAAPGVSKLVQLDVLRQEVAACTRCAELASTRTQTVFGVGNPNARLCFLGEAPGADEDKQGEPFVGKAGQLLNKIIEACTLKREEVYILNVLKCRPPGNRLPATDEVANCRGFLDRQLELIQPQFMCCLGTVAAQRLLDTTETIGRLRKRFFERDGIKIMCTYHPAYLLRNPPAKRDVWEDMKMLMHEMGIELP